MYVAFSACHDVLSIKHQALLIDLGGYDVTLFMIASRSNLQPYSDNDL